MLGCRLPGQIWEQVGGRGALKKCYELSTLLHYRMCCVCVYVVTCIIMCINCSYSRSKAARRRLKKALTSIRFISSLRWATFNQVTPCKIVECHANKEIDTFNHAFMQMHPWYLGVRLILIDCVQAIIHVRLGLQTHRQIPRTGIGHFLHPIYYLLVS